MCVFRVCTPSPPTAANVGDLELPYLPPLSPSLPHPTPQVFPLLPGIPRPSVSPATLQDCRTHQHVAARLRSSHHLEEPPSSSRTAQRAHETLREVSLYILQCSTTIQCMHESQQPQCVSVFLLDNRTCTLLEYSLLYTIVQNTLTVLCAVNWCTDKQYNRLLCRHFLIASLIQL